MLSCGLCICSSTTLWCLVLESKDNHIFSTSFVARFDGHSYLYCSIYYTSKCVCHIHCVTWVLSVCVHVSVCAHQYGVPMNVFLFPIVRSNWAETPKSTGRERGVGVLAGEREDKERNNKQRREEIQKEEMSRQWNKERGMRQQFKHRCILPGAAAYPAWCLRCQWAAHSDPWCHDEWPCSCVNDSVPEWARTDDDTHTKALRCYTLMYIYYNTSKNAHQILLQSLY